MQTTTDITPASLNYLEIWRLAFLRPTLKGFARIVSDPKAGIKWGLVWAAITSFVVWLVGPYGILVSGLITNTFGYDLNATLLVGAIVAAILGPIGMLMFAALVHGFSRLFDGAGSIGGLVYCWAVMQVPFIAAAGLAGHLTALFPRTREFFYSPAGTVIAFASLIAVACVYLYLLYAQIVALSAVEHFGIAKGFGVYILVTLVGAIAWGLLSGGVQVLFENALR